MAGQPGFSDVEERYAALSTAGDPMERLSAVVDFEIFRPVLEAALRGRIATASTRGWPSRAMAMGGQSIDATIIAAPCQTLTLEEKASIRKGGTPEGWS